MKQPWSPPWAEHVRGTVEELDVAEGEPREFNVRMRCGTCGEESRRRCTSGTPREWVARFARAHLHRNPLA